MAFDPDEYLNETGASFTATAEFDPDAYLKEEDEQKFDPNAYLAEESPLAGLEIPPAPEPLKVEQAVKSIGQIEGIKNAAMNAFDSSRQAMAVAGGVSPEEAEDISRLEYQKEARKLSPAYSEYLQAEGMDAVKAFAKNPFEITTNIVAEGLAGSLYSLGAGVAAGGIAAGATAATGVGAPLAPAAFLGGQIGGTFAGSLATEYGGKVLEELQNAGMDIKDPESIQKFFGDEKLMEGARSQALKRGVPVAIFDGVSVGIAGRLARLPVQALTKTPTRLAVTEGAAQAALGGGGEIAGAVAAGEEIQPKAVFAEVIGEAGPAAAEITVGRIAERLTRTPEQKQFDQNVLATQVATRASQDVAPATADAVERQVQDTLASVEETPDQRVARLQREAQEAAGEIELEEEGAGLPPERIKSARWFESAARNRLKELQDKDDAGVEDFTTQERDEFEFLKTSPTPEQIAERYGYGVAPAVEPTAVTTTTQPTTPAVTEPAPVEPEPTLTPPPTTVPADTLLRLDTREELARLVSGGMTREEAIADLGKRRKEEKQVISDSVNIGDEVVVTINEKLGISVRYKIVRGLRGGKAVQRINERGAAVGPELSLDAEAGKSGHSDIAGGQVVRKGATAQPATTTPTVAPPVETAVAPLEPVVPAEGAVEPAVTEVASEVDPAIAAQKAIAASEISGRTLGINKANQGVEQAREVAYNAKQEASLPKTPVDRAVQVWEAAGNETKYGEPEFAAGELRFAVSGGYDKATNEVKLSNNPKEFSSLTGDSALTPRSVVRHELGHWALFNQADNDLVGRLFEWADTADRTQILDPWHGGRAGVAYPKAKFDSRDELVSEAYSIWKSGGTVPQEVVPMLQELDALVPQNLQDRALQFADEHSAKLSAPTAIPQLEPLRRVARAEQTEEDVAGLVDAGFVELYNGQPVITQAGIDALPEAERPRLTPEARKIQIDTRTSEAAAEAISKNLRIGVDQVPVDVRMPAGWTLVGDVYVPPTRMAKIETFDVEALAEVDEDSDVFADVIKRKDEAKAAVAQKPEGSAFATQEEFRAAFDLRGEGHGRFATRLDLMVADGVITSEGRDIIMAVIYDNNTDDAFLNNMEMGSMRARATRSYGFGGVSRQTVQSANGKAIGYKPLLKMMQNARQNLQIDEKTAQTLSTFWHEFGHAGYYSLLDKAQKSVVSAAYKKTTKAQRIKFFESGVAAARRGNVTAQYYAKSETEWFAQSFAEYVLTQKSEQKVLVPIFETILNKIKGVFGKLFSRKEGTPELNDIFEYIIQGKGYGSKKIWWNGIQLSLAPAVYGTRGAQPIDPDFSRRLVEREKQNREKARRSISAPEVREARREPAITPQQDRDYLDAVERGDLETAQKMVDEAARRAGYKYSGWHGGTLNAQDSDNIPRTYGGSPQVDASRGPRTSVRGFFAAKEKEYSYEDAKAGIISKKYYFRFQKPFRLGNESDASQPWMTNLAYALQAEDYATASIEKLKRLVSTFGIYDYMLNKGQNIALEEISKHHDGIVGYDESEGVEIVVAFEPESIKSADPVTRDDQGNIIPLSQRFQPEQADIRYARTERDPEVQKAAQDLKAGTIDRDEYQRIVDMRMPLRKFEAVPIPATNDDMLRGLGERKAGERLKKDLIQNPEAIAEGTVLESRLDIPAYENENVWVVSLHEPRPDINKGNAGQVVAYTPTAVLRNVEFGVTEKAAVGIAAGKPKSTIATMRGEYVPMTAEQAYELANTNKEQWVEIGMNPVRHSYFYDKDTQTPVVSAEEVVQVGGMVLAKKPVFGKREDYLYARRVQMGRAGMETSAMEARLQELGFPTGGIIRVVNQPDADFEGRTIILDGKVTGIELNASALKDNAAIDRVLNHEFAESANADGALNKLVERLTPKEKKEINDTITRLRYEERARTAEEAARAIETLAEAWKGRGFFTRAVARVEAWASKLGFKLTRRAAEYIAARNLAEVNENVRKWHISDALANLNGARRVTFNGLSAVLIPPSEMRLAYSIAAYHGTPHEIQGGFQLKYVGTGEGAQAFGWGLYFAENPTVARYYREKLSQGVIPTLDQQLPEIGKSISQEAFSFLKGYEDIDSAIQGLRETATSDSAIIRRAWAGREDQLADLNRKYLEAADWIEQNKARLELKRDDGNLYSVELDVDQNELLDWEKPLSEQSQQVRDALKSFRTEFYDLLVSDGTDAESGGTAYERIAFALGSREAASRKLFEAGVKGVRYLDGTSRTKGAGSNNYVVFNDKLIKITARNGQPVDIRESRREPEAIPTFTEGTPEAATLKEMEASMAKVDSASEAKGGKPETYKISEIASVWMDSGLGERELQDAIVEYTNLTPANAARVAKAIAKQYGIQQQLVEAAAPLAEIAPEPEGAPRKSSVTKLIEQTTGVRKPVVKLQVSESAALKKQIQLKAREARETRKARKEAAEDLAKSITDYVKANPIRGPINSRQAMSITKKALKLDVNNEAAVDRFEMYVERVIENANYDRDLADARALIKRAKAFAKAKDTQGNVKTTLEAIANISPTLLDNPFEFNLVVQRYLLGLAPVTAKKYAVMPDADVRRYLESLETQIKDNQEVLDRAKAQRILDKQAAYAEEKGIPLDEAIAILNSEEFLQEKTIEKLEDLTKLLTSMAQESQKDVKAYDDSGATPKQKELISFMRKVNLDSLINEEKKRYIRFANNLLANGATFGMEQFQSIALGQEAAMKAAKDRRLSNKLSAWISPIGGDKAIDTARRIAAKTQSEADTFKNIFGREAVGVFRNILGLNRLDVAQTDSNRAKEQIANEFGEYFKGLRKKYGDDATGFEAKGYAGIAGYLIQTDGNKTEAESIPYRRRLMEQNIVELRKSDKQADLAEADLNERALAQLTGSTNADILSQLRALNPASYEQLMWVKDVMLPKWRDFLKEHDENFRNQANNYNNPDHLTITYKFPEGQLLPSEMEDVYQQDMIGMRIKQAANSIKRKDHPNLPVSKAGTIANIDINFGYNQYNALVDQVDKAFVAPAWEQVVAFTKAPEFEQVMGGRANALFVKNLLRDIQTSRSRQSLTDDEAQLIAGGVRLARKISTQAVLGGITQPLRQVPDQLAKLFFTTGRFDLITKNLLTTAQAAPLLNKFPIGRRGDAQAGTQYASQFSELARKVEASVTDRKWAKYRELMNKVGEFWMTPLRGSDVWAAKVSWMSYYEAELNKKGIKMESWEREAELVDTDQDRKEAAAYAEFAVDFYGGASDPTKMASLSKQTNNGWKEFAKLLFLPLNSFALQQKNSLISDLRDAYLRTGDRKASIAAIAGTLAGMAAFHGMRIYIIGGLVYPAGKALLMGIFGIDMDEPDEEEKQKQLEDNWRKFKASMYGNIVAGGLGQFVENNMIDAFNRTAYLWDANINPDSLLNDKGEIMSFRQYEKDVSPLYRFRSYGSSEYTFGLADVLTEQATHALAETQQLMTPEEMEKYTGNEQAYAAFATGVEWMYFFRLMDTDVKRIATDLKRQMDKGVEEREKELKRIREGR